MALLLQGRVKCMWANPNFTLIPTITGHKTLAWPYEKGHINREMLTRYLLGLNGRIYYIAGPSGMVTAMTALLKCSGVNEDDMRTEEFVKSFRKNGGDDETRTRDLCRDRAAF